MMASFNLISIVIATYNPGEVFKECIESLNVQSFCNYEVLVSDGGSHDGTEHLLSAGSIRNLQWSKSAPDNGLYYALNDALAHVKGTWLLVIGSDDTLAGPHALRDMAEHLIACDDSIDLVYTDLIIRSNGIRRIKHYPGYAEFCALYRGCPPIHHQTAFVRSKTTLDLRGFDTRYTIHSDFDLMSRVSINGGVKKIDAFVVVFSDKGFSARIQNYLPSIQEVMQIRSSLRFASFPYRLKVIYLRHLVKVLLHWFMSYPNFKMILARKQQKDAGSHEV